MSASASKYSLNHDQVGQSQTLLDFLKRKKKYQLEHTVKNKALYQTYAKSKIETHAEDQFPSTREQRTKYSNQYISNRNSSTNPRQTITPKKIQFEQNKDLKYIFDENQITYAQTSRGTYRNKNFLSMISPSRSRPNSVMQQHKQNIQNIPKSTKKWAKAYQNFTRKNITKCLNSIKQTINYLSNNINNIRQKSHGLSLLFNPIFNYLAQSSHPISRQVGDLRNKLKSFQAMIEAVQTNNSDSIVEIWHKNIEQHLQIEEANIRKDIQRLKNQEISMISTQKQKIIQHLQEQNKRILKQNEILQKRLEKSQNFRQNIQQAAQDRERNFSQQLDRLKGEYQAKLNQLNSKNQEIKNKYEQLLQQSKDYQKQLKNQKFMREQSEKKLKQEIKQLSQVKDAYLLNEIMVLKAEFNSDMGRVNQLYKLKQAELMTLLQKKQQQLQKKSFERGCDKQIESKIMIQANQIKQQNAHLKSKADCIITDMYRMNEELYQHWIALKDIKILTNRLGNYTQIKKIYDDLMFNDQLFL